MHLEIIYSTSTQPCQLWIVCRMKLNTTEAKQLFYNLFPLGLSFMQFCAFSSGMKDSGCCLISPKSLSVFTYRMRRWEYRNFLTGIKTKTNSKNQSFIHLPCNAITKSMPPPPITEIHNSLNKLISEFTQEGNSITMKKAVLHISVVGAQM